MHLRGNEAITVIPADANRLPNPNWRGGQSGISSIDAIDLRRAVALFAFLYHLLPLSHLFSSPLILLITPAS